MKQQNEGPHSKSGYGIGGITSHISQKVAMNNFLTPIVFVSNNYHGIQPTGNSDYQEFVDFDSIKSQIGSFS